MDSLESITETSKAWYVELKVNSQFVKFKIDSGAVVSAIPEGLSKDMGLKLEPPDKRL